MECDNMGGNEPENDYDYDFDVWRLEDGEVVSTGGPDE